MLEVYETEDVTLSMVCVKVLNPRVLAGAGLEDEPRARMPACHAAISDPRGAVGAPHDHC